MEIWKDIQEYKDYKISNYGNVKSLKKDKERILKPSKSSSGYLQVTLCKNGIIKNVFVHRLVANAFVPNELKFEEINHIDENKLNNHSNNLEWCNRKYNMNYGTIKEKMSVSKMKKVVKLDKQNNVIQIYNSIKIAAIQNNCLETNIVACCKHRNSAKTCKGFKWEYAN